MPMDKDTARSLLLDPTVPVTEEILYAATSPTFCAQKWVECNLFLTEGTTSSCCKSTKEKIPVGSQMIEWHNSPLRISERVALLNGDKPDGCAHCWKQEESGESRRHRSNHLYIASANRLAYRCDFFRVSDVVPTLSATTVGRVCQLLCAYCSEAASTQWEKENSSPVQFSSSGIIYHDYNSRAEVARGVLFTNDADSILIEWTRLLSTSIAPATLILTGGEPLLNRRLTDAVRYCADQSIHLRITSNLSIKPQLVVKLLGEMRGMVNVSLDGTHETTEYIRSGSNFEQIDRNIRFLLSIPTVSVRLLYTISAMNALRIDEILAYVRELTKINPTVRILWNYVIYPSYLCPDVLPIKYRQQMLRVLEDYEHESPDRIDVRMLRETINGINTAVEPDPQHVADFVDFVETTDARRGTNFTATFPELAEWYEECKRNAKQ